MIFGLFDDFWKRFLPVLNQGEKPERFIVLLNKEPFDYTKWREKYLDEGLSVRQLSRKAREYSQNEERGKACIPPE